MDSHCKHTSKTPILTNDFPEPVRNLAELTSLFHSCGERARSNARSVLYLLSMYSLYGVAFDGGWFSSLRRRFLGGLSNMFLSVVASRER